MLLNNESAHQFLSGLPFFSVCSIRAWVFGRQYAIKAARSSSETSSSPGCPASISAASHAPLYCNQMIMFGKPPSRKLTNDLDRCNTGITGHRNFLRAMAGDNRLPLAPMPAPWPHAIQNDALRSDRQNADSQALRLFGAFGQFSHRNRLEIMFQLWKGSPSGILCRSGQTPYNRHPPVIAQPHLPNRHNFPA